MAESQMVCWFCGKNASIEKISFSCEFDTYVHVDCCRKNLPVDREDHFNHTGAQSEALIIWNEIKPEGET